MLCVCVFVCDFEQIIIKSKKNENWNIMLLRVCMNLKFFLCSHRFRLVCNFLNKNTAIDIAFHFNRNHLKNFSRHLPLHVFALFVCKFDHKFTTTKKTPTKNEKKNQWKKKGRVSLVILYSFMGPSV